MAHHHHHGKAPTETYSYVAEKVPDHEDVFLFVNPKSGGNKGEDFLKVPQPFVTQLDDGRTASLHIFNLITQSQEGMKKFKEIATKAGRPLRMVVGGGDGTVMWADSEATKAGIDTTRECLIGIVPLGTGNDFARVAGWGGKNPKRITMNSCLKVHDMVKLWCSARTRKHDVWEVFAEVDEEEGRILKVSGDRTETEAGGGAKHFVLPMINYFSVGQESKVGIEFDKQRTKSQTANLLVYACAGIFTECDCATQQKIADLVSSLHVGLDASGPALFEYLDDDEPEEAGHLVGNPESIMFLNVNSYAGGAAHFWSQDSELGIEPEPRPEEVNVEADPGDRRIEVVTLPNIVNIALDRAIPNARRVHSGGPYYMEFFQPPDHAEQLDAYCEVDGEFYHLVNPLSVTVRWSKTLQVLQNNHPDSRNALWHLMESGMEKSQLAMEGIGDNITKIGRVSQKNLDDLVASAALGSNGKA